MMQTGMQSFWGIRACCSKPLLHDRFPSLNIFEAFRRQTADSEKITLAKIGIQSHSDYREGFASRGPTRYPIL